MLYADIHTLKRKLYMALAVEKQYHGVFVPGNQYGLGNSGGRPVKFTAEMLSELTTHLYNWIQEPDNLYLKNFCFQFGLEPDKIDEYCNRSEEFRQCWYLVKHKQEAKLVDLALKRKISDSMTKFVLVNVHKWKEKTEISGDSQNPLALVLEQIAKQNQDPIEIQALEAEQVTDQAIEPSQAIDTQQHN